MSGREVCPIVNNYQKIEKQNMMFKNKRGVGAVVQWVIASIMILTLLGVGYMVVNLTGDGAGSQTFTDTDTGETVVSGVVQTKTVGGAGSIKITAFEDSATSSNIQLGSTAYCWKKGSPSDFVDTAGGKSLSNSGSVSFTGIKDGEDAMCVTFNASHIGFPKDVVASESGTGLELSTGRVTTMLKLTTKDKDDTVISEFPEANFTLSADGTYTFQSMKIENNGTNVVFPLGLLAFDTILNSNITDIEIGGIGSDSVLKWGVINGELIKDGGTEGAKVSEYTIRPERIRTYDWFFKFEAKGTPYLMLGPNDYVTVTQVKFTGNGNGCSGYGTSAIGEEVTTTAVSWHPFRSVDPASRNQILGGYEDDQSTPANIGASDFSWTHRCRGA